MIDGHNSTVRKEPDREQDRVLRAKYLDWCSARVAERFVKLTPEEIYQLAERTSRKPSRPPERGGSVKLWASGLAGVTDERGAADSSEERGVAGAPPSFRTIVERVTEALTAEMNLPAYDEWSEAYQADPARFDDELLGLWRGAL